MPLSRILSSPAAEGPSLLALEAFLWFLFHTSGKGRGAEGRLSCLEQWFDLAHVCKQPAALCQGVSQRFHPVAEDSQDLPPCFPKGAAAPHSPQRLGRPREGEDVSAEEPVSVTTVPLSLLGLK